MLCLDINIKPNKHLSSCLLSQYVKSNSNTLKFALSYTHNKQLIRFNHQSTKALADNPFKRFHFKKHGKEVNFTIERQRAADGRLY